MAKVDYRKDKAFYKKIWEQRDHVSEVSGTPLGEEANTWFFAHILGKGAYPAFRHRQDNILLMTKEEHFTYDHATDRARQMPQFAQVFEKAQELKEEYHRMEKPTVISSRKS